MRTNKLIIIFTFILNTTCFAQVDLFFPLIKWGTRYDWKSIEKTDNQLKQKLIDLNPSEFGYYRQNSEYGPKLSDLSKDLHVIDLNNDGLNDIIFDGYSGGEPFEISFFVNDGNTFRKIFTQYQGITKIEFQNKVLSKVYIQDWGCCSEYLVTNSVYAFNKRLENQLVSKSKYFLDCELPKDFYESPIKFLVKNDNYNIRLNPFIDDISNTHGYDGEPITGNIIGKLKKESIGFALGEKQDSTGRVWWFVAIPDNYEILNTLFYDRENETSYKLGWISSRFVERIEEK